MKTFIQQLKNPKYKPGIILLACIVLFMQCYLLQHQFDHYAEHDSDETTQECYLCLGSQQISYSILPNIDNLLLSLVGTFIVIFFHRFLISSSAFLLPHTRAPPSLHLNSRKFY